MKKLLIVSTLVQLSYAPAVFAKGVKKNQQTLKSVRQSLWYQGIEDRRPGGDDGKASPKDMVQRDLPEELSKAMEKVAF